MRKSALIDLDRINYVAARLDMGDLLDQGVHELAIVGDEQQRSPVAAQPSLEPDDRIEIQVIRRLVEQQQIRATHERPGEMQAHAPAAGERCERGPLVGGPKAQTAHDLRGPGRRRVGIDLFEPAVEQGLASAVAYPLRILNFHEIFNDTVGGAPVAVTYCPLCDSVSVIDRQMGDEVKEFGVSGLLHNSNVLLYDRQDVVSAESLWSQVRMVSIQGLDAGENRLFSVHHFQTKGANTLLMPGIGAMGYAIPAALASKLVFPDRQAIALSGDGGFGMAMNGMMTAIDEDIPIVSVVMNNSALGWVRHGQGNRTIASAFAEMNFAEMARVMGCHGVRVEKPGDLAAGMA